MIELRPHQKEGVEFLLAKRRAVLGDDVGLGKTFTSIEAALRAVEDVVEPMILIVVPPHILYQWQDALETYLEGRRDLPVHLLFTFSQPVASKGYGIFLMTTTMLYNKALKTYPHARRTRWNVIIMDEAHRARKHTSQTYKNFKTFACRHLFLLTGSPLENNPADMFGYLSLIDWVKYRGYWDFVDGWMVTYSDPYKKNVVGVKKELRSQWMKLITHYMLRRIKNTTPPFEVVVPVRLSPSMQEKHDDAKHDWKIVHGGGIPDERIRSAGELMATLRQLVSKADEKVVAAQESINDLPANEGVIVFCWFRATAYHLVERLHPDGRKVYVITGETEGALRETYIREWQAGCERGEGPVLIGTLSTIGEGLNLQQASYVMIYEEHYLPGTLKQAIGRADRMGQKADVVTVIRMHVKGTVEDGVHRIVTGRARNIGEAILEEVQRE